MEFTIDDIFNEDELNAYENITANSTNIEELKKTGNVTVITEEKDGVVYETINYESHDGKVAFTRIKSYDKKNQNTERIKALNELIEQCVKTEDYEQAARYKSQLEAIS